MKTRICVVALYLMAAGQPAWGTLFSSGTLSGAAIPDNSTIGTGDSLSYTVSGAGTVLDGVTLTFTLQGGFASDLTGYLRMGTTSSAPVYDLTTLVQSEVLSEGTPNTYSIDFTTASFQTAFNGQDPNSTSTLFFADQSPGGQTAVVSWSLEISAVPEPVNLALGIFGVVLGAGAWLRAHSPKRQGKA